MHTTKCHRDLLCFISWATFSNWHEQTSFVQFPTPNSVLSSPVYSQELQRLHIEGISEERIHSAAGKATTDYGRFVITIRIMTWIVITKSYLCLLCPIIRAIDAGSLSRLAYRQSERPAAFYSLVRCGRYVHTECRSSHGAGGCEMLTISVYVCVCK